MELTDGNTILHQIVRRKVVEVDNRKLLKPISVLESEVQNLKRIPIELNRQLLNNGPNYITEFKRKSPSKGWIFRDADPEQVVSGYSNTGAFAISVLTDEEGFAGTDQHLIEARKVTHKPLLRKDFVVSEYQIIEAKLLGADIILLIAAALSPAYTHTLAKFARNLGLNVLLEVHNLSELESHYFPTINLVGVNNRNLHTFEVSINHSFDLIQHFPTDVIKVSESGLNNPADVATLYKAGYDAFLIGEHFMATGRPDWALSDFIAKTNLLL